MNTKLNTVLENNKPAFELLQSIGIDAKFYNSEEINERLQMYPNGVYVAWMSQYFPNESEAMEAIEITEGHTQAMFNGRIEIKNSPYICNAYTNNMNLIDDTSEIDTLLQAMNDLENETEEDTDLIINDEAVTTFVLSYNKSKEWGFTVSIKEAYFTAKKLGFAGGMGYDKTAAAFSDFIYSYLLKDTPHEIKTNIIERVQSGAFSGCYSGLDIPKAVEFFKVLGFDFSIEEDKGGEFKIGKKYEFKLRRAN